MVRASKHDQTKKLRGISSHRITLQIPETLGKTLYSQPLHVNTELKARRPGLIFNLVIVVFGLAMGVLCVYAAWLYSEAHYWLIGLSLLAIFGWIFWEHVKRFTQVRLGFVCENGVGYALLNSNGHIMKTVAYAFSPTTRVTEKQGRTGPTANMRDYWELVFHEPDRKPYTIAFIDVGRDGYGHADAADPDKMEYLIAKDAFVKYRSHLTQGNHPEQLEAPHDPLNIPNQNQSL